MTRRNILAFPLFLASILIQSTGHIPFPGATPNATIDIPLHNKDDEWSFDHFDAVALSIADAPAADEIVVAVALATRGRPFARVKRGG